MSHIPIDLITAAGNVTITGGREVMVENYKGIIDYKPDRIKIGLRRGSVEIIGEKLLIKYYSCDEMKIIGKVKEIKYV